MRVIFFFLLCPLLLMGQKNYATLVDSFVMAEYQVNHFNGNVAVANSGKIIYQKAFGFRNYTTKEPLDNNSVFELASISKQFTAVGILLLLDKGLIKLSDSLRLFFPELPYSNVTIKNMLTHTSGLPDYMDAMLDKIEHEKVIYNKDVISFFAREKIPLNFKPGQRSEYCNTAFMLLASIIEKVSGNNYSDYMRMNIFTPLKMQHTRIYNTRRAKNEIIQNYAFGYVYSDSLKRNILPDSLPGSDFVICFDGIQGDGSVISTTGDLLKWNAALHNNALLKKATQDEMMLPHAIFDTLARVNYGYGVFLGENENGKYRKHGGDWPGYTTDLINYPDRDLTIIVLSNNNSDAKMISGGIAYILLDKLIVFPYKHSKTKIDTSILVNYVGKYIIPNVPNPMKINIIKKNGVLFYSFDNTQKDTELIPESNSKFFVNNRDMQIEFDIDEYGSVKNAYYIYCSMKKRMTRLNCLYEMSVTNKVVL